MGQKYLPTDKDNKDTRRFFQNQKTSSKFIRTSGTPPARKPKKK